MFFRTNRVTGIRSRLVAGLLVALAVAPAGAPATVSAQQEQKGSTPPAPAQQQKGTPANPEVPCAISFADVHPTDFFYAGVQYLFCLNAIGGYSDGTFRPGNSTTRGQLAKILTTSLGWAQVNPPSPSFSDVPPGSAFYIYVETARAHNAIGGYSDGTFRPNNEVTRGQLAKMVSMAEGWPLANPPSPRFNDVAPGSPFYQYVETVAAHGAISGYADGSFRPGGLTTRGQVAKVTYLANNGTLTPQEQETINIINQRRGTLGLVSLRTDMSLSLAGRRHSSDIGPLGLCQHEGTDGSSPWDRAAQAGYGGFAMGEVVACNYPTPLAAVDGWWASPGHRDILVDPNARDIGCGWWINSQGYGWQTCMTGQP
jgi:uncharacterized protein YkwD